jgi:hypothetical protein
MYLPRLHDGQHLFERLLLKLARRTCPRVPFDVVRILTYRPEYFGAPFCRVGHALMRGSPDAIGWTVGERELMAAFTSRLNHCVF